MSVYVLQLENGKYYVGYTEKPIYERINEHKNNRGAKWTKLHKYVATLMQKPGDTKLETVTTLEMMAKFGWQNVRGGTYTKINMTNMPPDLREYLTCTKCNDTGHLDEECEMA